MQVLCAHPANAGRALSSAGGALLHVLQKEVGASTAGTPHETLAYAALGCLTLMFAFDR